MANNEMLHQIDSSLQANINNTFRGLRFDSDCTNLCLVMGLELNFLALDQKSGRTKLVKWEEKFEKTSIQTVGMRVMRIKIQKS